MNALTKNQTNFIQACMEDNTLDELEKATIDETDMKNWKMNPFEYVNCLTIAARDKRLQLSEAVTEYLDEAWEANGKGMSIDKFLAITDENFRKNANHVHDYFSNTSYFLRQKKYALNVKEFENAIICKVCLINDISELTSTVPETKNYVSQKISAIKDLLTQAGKQLSDLRDDPDFDQVCIAINQLRDTLSSVKVDLILKVYTPVTSDTQGIKS